MEVLCRREVATGVSALARELEVPKSAVHRLLQVMRTAGWIRQTPAGDYEPTLRLWELGLRLADRIDLRRLADPHLRALGQHTSETVHLSILDGVETLYLEKIDSPQPVLASFRVGAREPAYCVATGKAMLAYASPEVIEAVTASMPSYTPLTLTNPAALLDELERVRRDGYAINRGEWRGSVLGIAVPILDSRGRSIAAIGVSCPKDRLSLTKLHEFAPAILAAARAISVELGGGPSAASWGRQQIR